MGGVIPVATLESIQQRILWLAVRMVDAANHDRPTGEIKVGTRKVITYFLYPLIKMFDEGMRIP